MVQTSLLSPRFIVVDCWLVTNHSFSINTVNIETLSGSVHPFHTRVLSTTQTLFFLRRTLVSLNTVVLGILPLIDITLPYIFVLRGFVLVLTLQKIKKKIIKKNLR